MPDFTDSIKIQNQSLTIQDIEGLLINNKSIRFIRSRPIDPCLFPVFDSIEELIQEKYNEYILTTSTYLSRFAGSHTADLTRWLGKHNAEKIDRDTADFYILKVEEQKSDPNRYNVFLVLAIKIGYRDIEIEAPKLISSYQRNFFMLTIPKWVGNKRQGIKDLIDQNLSLNAINFDGAIQTGGDNIAGHEAYRKIYKPLKDLYCDTYFDYDSKYRILLDVNISTFIEASIEAGDELSCKIIKTTKKLYELLTIDFLIIDYLGNPVLGIAYHSTDFTFNKHNDNIKRTVLERAGVAFKVFDNNTYKQREFIYEVENCIQQYERHTKGGNGGEAILI